MRGLTRRELLQLAAGGAVGAAAGALGLRAGSSATETTAPPPPAPPPPAASTSAGVAPMVEKALGPAPNGRPWNVLLMVSDEHNPRFIDPVSPWIGTPHLSRLCAEGVRCARAYATAPICAPARMGILTGNFPTETGVMGNGQALDPRTRTLAHTFGAAGYATACIGKTHVSQVNAAFGFDLWMSAESDAFRLAASSYKESTRPLPTPSEEREIWAGIADRRLRGAPISGDRTMMSAVVLDQTAEWLKSRPADRPFFLYTSWTEPHWVWNLPRSFYGRHHPDEIPMPRWLEGDLDDAPAARALLLKNGWDRMTEAQQRLCRARYADAVCYSDWVVGELLALLDQHGLKENTIVVYTSDHGDMAAEKRMWLKSVMFDDAAGVPLIFRMPGALKAGTTTDALMSGADLLPTLAGLTGVPLASEVSGQDRSACLKGDASAAPELLFSCLNGRASTRLPRQFMVRDDRYKLVRYRAEEGEPPGEVRELYDMTEDPMETRNLASDLGQRKRVAELAEVGDLWLGQRRVCPYPVLRIADLPKGGDPDDPEYEVGRD